MGSAVGLSYPTAYEGNGLLYVVGQRDGQYWIRRSADNGRSWLAYSDGSTERPVAPATCNQRVGLVKLVGQGAPLLVCVPNWPHLELYASFNDGETWESLGRV